MPRLGETSLLAGDIRTPDLPPDGWGTNSEGSPRHRGAGAALHWSDCDSCPWSAQSLALHQRLGSGLVSSLAARATGRRERLLGPEELPEPASNHRSAI